MKSTTRARVERPYGAAVALAFVLVASAVGTGVAVAGQDAGRWTGDGPNDGAANALQGDGTTTGQPANASRFEVVAVSSNVDVGESGILSVAIENVGDELVRDATVTVSSASPDVQLDGGERATVPVGAVEPGEIERVPVGATVGPAAEQRRYTVDVTVSYRTEADGPRRNETFVAEFTPGAARQLDVEATNSSLYVDETGTLSGELENAGNRDLSDVVLVFEGAGNASGPFTAADDRRLLGEVAAGRSESFSFEVDVAAGVEPGPRQFAFRVEYLDEDGRRQRSGLLYEEWAVRERRETFELRNVESTLEVGDDGRVTGQVRYRGDEAASDAVLALAGPEANGTGSLSPTETEYALGDLEPNATANFSFEFDASDGTVAGPRQLSFRVRYVDEDGQTRRSDPLYAQVEVREEREAFRVEPVASSVAAGSSGVVRLQVTNVDDRPVTDVSAKLFVEDPVSAEDDEAFVPRLGPDESATLAFRVSVADDALAKVYPLSVDFEYDDADGDTELSNTYRVGLSVRESEGGGFFGLLAAGGLVVAALALVARGRR